MQPPTIEQIAIAVSIALGAVQLAQLALLAYLAGELRDLRDELRRR